MGEIVFFLERTRTSILDDVDLLTEAQSPIAPTRPVYFDVVVEAGRPGFDADSFRQCCATIKTMSVASIKPH